MTTLIDIFDPTKRPRGPRFEITPEQRRRGGRLALIHQLHLDQLAEVEALIAAIDAGHADEDAVASSVSGLAATQNYRTFGSLCGRECRNLTFHHTGEDQAIFPVLRVGNRALDAVIDRLAEEHLVIHGWIERLLERLVDYRAHPDADTYGALRDDFRVLARLVRSHFGYEQTELEDAIGKYGPSF